MHAAVKHALQGLAKALQNAPRRGGRQTPAPGARARLAASCAALALCLGAAPAVEFRWRVDPAKAAPAEFDLYRGETAVFRPEFPGTNIQVEALCWQTNGMGSAWWTVPGNTFAPSNDVGAAKYRFFVKATDGTVVYRANGSLRMLGSPGESPNALPIPPRTIDFATVDVANAPWATLADVAAATNAIPAPDMSAYLRRDGGEMTGTYFLRDGAGNYTSIYPYQTMIGNGTDYAAYTRSGIYYKPSSGFYNLAFPAKSGTLALTSDIPAAGPVYAENAPFSISCAVAASRSSPEETYLAPKGDVAEKWLRQGSYQDAQFFVVGEERPAEYAYDAPTGTWSIVSDAAGAASGISGDGYLASSRAASGSVVVEYATPTNGAKRASVFLSQTARDRLIDPFVELPGTLRHAWTTNTLAHFATVDYSGSRHKYPNTYSEREPEYFVDALCPYNTWSGAATAANAAFFWPELREALMCCSIQRTDQGGVRAQQILCVSPHFAVCAKHFGVIPPSNWSERFCVSVEPFEASTRALANPRINNPANDLALVRFRDAMPPQCIAKLLRAEDAARLSPTLFEKAAGILYNQHGVVQLAAMGECARPRDYGAYGNATNAFHAGHLNDSGHAYGMVTARAQFIPLGCLQTANDGPSLLDAGNQAWIEAELARYGEAPTYWTIEELTEE